MNFMSNIFRSYLRASSVCVLHPTGANSVRFAGLHVLLSIIILITIHSASVPSVYEEVTPHHTTVSESFLRLLIHFRCLLNNFPSLPSPHHLPKHNQRYIAIPIPKADFWSSGNRPPCLGRLYHWPRCSRVPIFAYFIWSHLTLPSFTTCNTFILLYFLHL